MPGELLHGVFARHGLPRADGRPLYAYRLTADELTALGEALRACYHGGRRALANDRAQAACFFAAGSFCERHEGGAWSWEPIWQALSWDRGMGRWYEELTLGLQGLRRPLVRGSSRRLFLVTVACEGGLPLRLLREEGDRLQRYVRHVLADHEAFGLPARALAEQRAHDLPRTRRLDVVYGLVGDLVESVAALRRRLPAGAKDPMRHLDAEEPGWRDRLPLRLDDEVARGLLLGLLQAARAGGEPPARDFVSARVLLDLDRARPLLARELGVRPQAQPEPFKAWAGFEVRSRTRLWLVRPTGERRELAQVRPVGQHLRLDVTGEVTHPVTSKADGWDLVGALGAGDSSPIEITGLSPLGELPWVFVRPMDGEGPWRLAGTGAVKTRSREAVVALPAAASWEAAPPGGADPVGTLELADERRVLVKLQGRLVVRDADESWEIVAGAERASTRVELWGRCVALGSGGDRVFLGAPTVRDAESRATLTSALEWRPPGGGAWRRGDPLGEVVVQVRDAGSVVLRERVVVLPAGFRHALRPASTQGEGDLVLSGLEPGTQVGASFSGGEATVTAGPGGLLVRCRETSEAPGAQVELRLLFDGGLAATVYVASPIARYGFVRASGRLLPHDARVSPARLPGVRALALSPRVGVEYELVARPPVGVEVNLGQLAAANGDAFELPLDPYLDQITALLASSDQLDATVELRLLESGDPKPRAKLVVTCYEALLGREPLEDGGLALRLVASAGGMDPGRLRLEARPLEEPGAEPRLLEPAEDGRWRFPTSDASPGAWLVTAWEGDLAFARPTLVLVPGEPPETDSPLLRAIRQPDPTTRAAALRLAVQALASDATHADWARALEFVGTLRDLPAGTFDVVRQLVREPDVMAMVPFFLDATSRPRICRAFEALPFAWSLVGLRSWARAVQRVQDAHPSLAQAVVRDALRWAADALPGAACVAHVAQARVGSHDLAPPGLQDNLRLVRSLLEAPSARTASGRWLAKDLQAGGPQALLAHHLTHLTDQLRRSATHARWWPPLASTQLARALGVAALAPRLEPSMLPTERPFERAVLDAPLFAAAACAFSRAPTEEGLVQLRRLRAFDEQFFDGTYQIHLARLLPLALAEDQELSA